MNRSLAWAVALALLAAPAALAQEEPKVETKVETKSVTFNSADGVELQGTLYKSLKGPASPCVILLHSLFTDPNKGDWDGLALMLARKGFAVLRFDFRGHGKSTVVDAKKFWSSQVVNATYMPALARKNPPPVNVVFKDFEQQPRYVPQLANDILAARVFLDQENDGGTVNTNSVYLIGATDTAPLGLVYMAAEWTRPNVIPQASGILTLPPQRGEAFGNQSDPAGTDVAGAVWLSASTKTALSERALERLSVLAPSMREKNHMWFLYGADDKSRTTGAVAQNFYANNVLQAKPPRGAKLFPLKFTEAVPIKGTKNVGVALLGNKLGTEEKIVEFLEKIEKDRKSPPRIATRGYTKPPLLLGSYYGAFQR